MCVRLGRHGAVWNSNNLNLVAPWQSNLFSFGDPKNVLKPRLERLAEPRIEKSSRAGQLGEPSPRESKPSRSVYSRSNALRCGESIQGIVPEMGATLFGAPPRRTRSKLCREPSSCGTSPDNELITMVRCLSPVARLREAGMNVGSRSHVAFSASRS